MDKVMCITGASSGIGLATALKFAEEGWRVYAGTRNVQRDQQQYADKKNLQFIEMDVAHPDSLEGAFDQIRETEDHIDVLFCNAGVGYLRSLGQASVEEIQQIFNTNVYGVMHTIRAGLPLLQKADRGYLLATSSVGGLVGQPMNEIYCASKFAVEGLLESLATYYPPFFNIDVTLLEPGAIDTNFGQTVMENLQASGGIIEDEYKPVIDAYINTFRKRHVEPQTPESVANVVYHLVQMETKPLRVRSSEAAESFSRFKTEKDPTGLEGMYNTRKLQLEL
ncbi:SDR family oxidoreductase [Marininema halotolerans]|uniref:NADP-dependent 3-hydroxy acid dehydrogenase YdfG n=1 Tax=Marininema halotolerans TaxID=1155944 RepID=A0A1I6NU64_9BACL|nr:SDR family oxidoreductase [Marininema halotolerans]SFS31556.1 NADP-dependent 3-hydroxy acid dehydrogenase YdfG [Marininema halotolerans]